MFLFSDAYQGCGKSPNLVLHSCFLPVCTLLSLQNSSLLKPKPPRRNMIYKRKVFYCPTQLVPPKQKQGAGHLLDVIRTVGVQDVANLDQGPGTSVVLEKVPSEGS